MPVQKTGAEKPNRASSVTKWLNSPFGRRAEDHTQNHPDHQREDLRREDKKKGRGKAFGNQAGDRCVEEEAVAEIQSDHIAKIDAKLDKKRLVEAVIRPDARHHSSVAPPMSPAMVSAISPGAIWIRVKFSTTTASSSASA